MTAKLSDGHRTRLRFFQPRIQVRHKKTCYFTCSFDIWNLIDRSDLSQDAFGNLAVALAGEDSRWKENLSIAPAAMPSC
jgi:hypothetical protein